MQNNQKQGNTYHQQLVVTNIIKGKNTHKLKEGNKNHTKDQTINLKE